MLGLVMAIAVRAAARRREEHMHVGRRFIIGSTAIWLRLAAPLTPNFGLVNAAAILWCLGWVAFTLGFRPALIGPAICPVLSGKKHDPQQDSNKRNTL